ncbi:hypothetical protein MSWAN_1487 [Methanobacterium paludis]|uniref:Uncharacterized protein n=2 Tax=Methanobacterium paludis (strain DSM 25820 / JCM 18151 / SWAN1) TaxID=868131 RepID=F6D7X8_METPW|nr:hypothetical protein MSWAN_1487 [Methanobacterium paludis]
MERDPQTIVLTGLMAALWNTMGEGCTALWRQGAENFYEILLESGKDMSSPEASLNSVKEYFEEFKSVSNMDYKIEDGEAVVKVEGCSAMPVAEYMDANNIPEEHSCLFFNLSMVALEHATGNMYDVERERDEPGNCHAHIKRI